MRPHLAILILMIPVPAFAWAPKPHRIIADVAQRQLAATCPGALTPTLQLLGVKRLADVAVVPHAWPEDTSVAGIGLWQFVNIPYGKDYDAARDCPRDLCTIGGIGIAQDILIGHVKAAPRVQRAVLALLIQLTGDLYQPFHCATSDTDHNAESIHVTVNGKHVPGNHGSRANDNLHFLWDVSLVEWRHLREDEYVNYLFERIARNELSLGHTPTPDAAANSNYYAVQAIDNVSDHTDLTSDYMNANANVVDQQLVYAGAELAELLQQVWASKLTLDNCKP
jgi:hypothetical protein